MRSHADCPVLLDPGVIKRKLPLDRAVRRGRLGVDHRQLSRDHRSGFGKPPRRPAFDEHVFALVQQKAQMPRVDADERDALAPMGLDGVQHRPVAADRDDAIGVGVVADRLEPSGNLNRQRIAIGHVNQRARREFAEPANFAGAFPRYRSYRLM